MHHETLLQRLRQQYVPPLPHILQDLKNVTLQKGKATSALGHVAELQTLFPRTFGRPKVTFTKGSSLRGSQPLRVGVVFSGGQASGGHNVIAGLFDALKSLHKESKLFGFEGGPSGIITAKYKEITAELLAPYRNQGGFDLIGSGRTKIESSEQLEASLTSMLNLKLDGLVVIGGDDSNTNAAILAEYFLSKGCATKVVGVPKTIDGDLKGEEIETSFGFDTACKVFSELIGNIERDALSAKKYYHFIKMMGRSASHIALECALSTHPNATLISEEVAFQKKTLADIVKDLADMICKRAELGKNFGVVLIPEGLIEFIPEMKVLIGELNQVEKKLTPASKKCLDSLPESVQKQLLLERDPHGNVQVSLIETERVFTEAVSRELELRKKNGTYQGKFNPVHHFFGYEGRAAFPSNFDAQYCYALGFIAPLLIEEGLTGYMCSASGLSQPATEWQVGGIPITMLMNIEKRHEALKPVIKKALVDLTSKPFLHFQKERQSWMYEDTYRFPGPIQYFGDTTLTDQITCTMGLESCKK